MVVMAAGGLIEHHPAEAVFPSGRSERIEMRIGHRHDLEHSPQCATGSFIQVSERTDLDWSGAATRRKR